MKKLQLQSLVAFAIVAAIMTSANATKKIGQAEENAGASRRFKAKFLQ